MGPGTGEVDVGDRGLQAAIRVGDDELEAAPHRGPKPKLTGDQFGELRQRVLDGPDVEATGLSSRPNSDRIVTEHPGKRLTLWFQSLPRA
jgi:hypothetical protein